MGRIADACVGWLVRGDTLVELAVREDSDHLATVARADWKWGTATARERLLHRVGAVADLTAGCDDLAGTHTLLRAMTAGIRSRWPGLSRLPDRSAVRVG